MRVSVCLSPHALIWLLRALYLVRRHTHKYAVHVYVCICVCTCLCFKHSHMAAAIELWERMSTHIHVHIIAHTDTHTVDTSRCQCVCMPRSLLHLRLCALTCLPRVPTFSHNRFTLHHSVITGDLGEGLQRAETRVRHSLQGAGIPWRATQVRGPHVCVYACTCLCVYLCIH